MNIRFQMTPVAGPVTVTFADDFLIDLEFIDPATGETVYDFGGENAVHASQLLASLPPGALADVVRSQAVDLVKLAKGVV